MLNERTWSNLWRVLWLRCLTNTYMACFSCFFYQANNIFGWIVMLEFFMFLFLPPYFYYHIYLFYFFIFYFFMLDVGWSFYATFSYIVAIWWELVLLVEETGEQGQNHHISYARGLEVLSIRIINNIFFFIYVHLYFA